MSEDPESLNRTTDRARKTVRLSAAFSKQFAHQEIEPQDLLDALAHMGGISELVLRELEYPRKEAPEPVADADRMIDASKSLMAILAEAHEQGRLLGHSYSGTEHLLLALAHTHSELLPDSNAVRSLVLEILGCDL